jgi:poly-gamma-glutamate synthesis protein (capsule biosynthesis protein)
LSFIILALNQPTPLLSTTLPNLPPNRPFPSLFNSSTIFTQAMDQVERNEPSPKRVTGLIVPHHLLAPDLIASGFAFARRHRYQRIIILSPDHFKRSDTAAAYPLRDFATVLGRVLLDRPGLQSLEGNPLFSPSDLFSHEHGVQALLPFVAAYFPEAKIIPLALKSNAKPEQWREIALALEPLVDAQTLIVQSTDFSHYLGKKIAEDMDKISLNILLSTDPTNVHKLNQSNNIDSKFALYIQLFFQKNANSKITVLSHKTSCDYEMHQQCHDETPVTTYYVVAFYNND